MRNFELLSFPFLNGKNRKVHIHIRQCIEPVGYMYLHDSIWKSESDDNEIDESNKLCEKMYFSKDL